jgi:hypothetical protein
MADPAPVLGSLARITDFAERPPDIAARPRGSWRRGDYVMVQMVAGGAGEYTIETVDGSPEVIREGDYLVGALGVRAATLEVVGSWEAVGDDLRMQTLTAAGVLGVCTSASPVSAPLADVRYVGHAMRDGRALGMSDFVPDVPRRSIDAPIILIIGTSMDSGKTVAASAMIRELAAMGARVVGMKVTGVGRYRDIMAMRSHGAARILDFVDVGLPSSLVPEAEYEERLAVLLSMAAAEEPDVVVIEAGASPLEPYRGDVAMRVLLDQVSVIVLCASDPYAVVGILHAFDLRPGIVTGPCTSTEAGVNLIQRLCGLPALNMFDEANAPKVADFLRHALPQVAGGN